MYFLQSRLLSGWSWLIYDHPYIDCKTYIRGNHIGIENITNNTEEFVNTVTVKADMLKEWCIFLDLGKLH